MRREEMRQRAAAAAAATPTIDDRLNAARSLVGNHPTSGTVQPPVISAPQQSVQGGRGRFVAQVPQELIDSNPFNARCIYRPENIREISASLSANGQQVPALATVRDGRYVLADGERRRRGLKMLGDKPMDLMVYDGLTDRDLYLMSYRANVEREEQTALDNAIRWRDLLDRKIFATEADLAQDVGYSEANVNKTLGLLRLSDQVRAVVEQNPVSFGLTILYEVVLYEEVAGPEQALVMANLVLEGAMTRKHIQEARKQLVTSKPPRKTKEMARQYKLEGSTVIKTGVLKEWDSNKILIEVEAIDPAKRAELVAKFRELLGVG